VFFAPVEFTPGRHEANRKIVATLSKANIPVVLLVRFVERYPATRRSMHSQRFGCENLSEDSEVDRDVSLGALVLRSAAYLSIPARTDARLSIQHPERAS